MIHSSIIGNWKKTTKVLSRECGQLHNNAINMLTAMCIEMRFPPNRFSLRVFVSLISPQFIVRSHIRVDSTAAFLLFHVVITELSLPRTTRVPSACI